MDGKGSKKSLLSCLKSFPHSGNLLTSNEVLRQRASIHRIVSFLSVDRALSSPEIAGGHTTYTFTIINVPGATSTEANGINSLGQIVGAYQDASGGHGFLDIGGTFTPINVPFAGAGLAAGIDNNGHGQILEVYTVEPENN